jgi:hypothetical protein
MTIAKQMAGDVKSGVYMLKILGKAYVTRIFRTVVDENGNNLGVIQTARYNGRTYAVQYMAACPPLIILDN